MQVIRIRTQNRYGNVDRLIVDEGLAFGVQLLTGRKTVTNNDAEGLRLLGFVLIDEDDNEIT